MTLIPRTKPIPPTVEEKKDLLSETEEKARALQSVETDLDAASKEVEQTLAERSRLMREAKAAEQQRAGHERATNIAKSGLATIKAKTDVLKVEVASKSNELHNLEKALSEQGEEFVAGRISLEEIKCAIEEASLRLADLQNRISESDKLLNDLESQALDWQNKINTLEEEESIIMGRIETAIENFRIFENRIALISKETGYQVGYQEINKPIV